MVTSPPPPPRSSFLSYPVFVPWQCSFVLWLISWCFTLQSGVYVFELFDNFAATFSLLLIGAAECIALMYVYGMNKYLADVLEMTGKFLNFKPLHWLWKYIIPLLAIVLSVFAIVNSARGKYEIDSWSVGVGWVLSVSSVVPFFLFLIKNWNVPATRDGHVELQEVAA